VLYNKNDMAGNASTLGWWFAVNLKKLVGFVVVIFVALLDHFQADQREWVGQQPHGQPA